MESEIKSDLGGDLPLTFMGEHLSKCAERILAENQKTQRAHASEVLESHEKSLVEKLSTGTGATNEKIQSVVSDWRMSELGIEEDPPRHDLTAYQQDEF